MCRERRLKHQLNLTKDAKLQKLGKKLCDNLDHFFEGVEVNFQLRAGKPATKTILPWDSAL